MDYIIENNVKFYNLRKLAEAKRISTSDDSKDIIKAYELLAGKYEIMEVEKVPKAVELGKKQLKAERKTTKTKKSVAKKTKK